MEGIYEATPEFDFNQLKLISPTSVSGGNYFIKFRLNQLPLYIQPPKCLLKNGIQKSGKKLFSDLIFTHENEEFIQWMENLEIYCRKQIFENRSKWFETDLDETDIENFFTSPLKIYKSGKNYIARTNIPTLLGNCNLKIYNENEETISIDKIKENDTVVSVLEFQGIKCSPRNFQIDIEIKQMMIMNSVSLFEKCVFAPIKKQQPGFNNENDDIITIKEIPQSESQVHINNNIVETNTITNVEISNTNNNENDSHSRLSDLEETNYTANPGLLPTFTQNIESELEEIEFNLDELPQENSIQLKKRDTVYYDMYREAKRKAKMARDLAISSYLEAKNIKQTYMLNDIEDSDSDLDDDDFNTNMNM